MSNVIEICMDGAMGVHNHMLVLKLVPQLVTLSQYINPAASIKKETFKHVSKDYIPDNTIIYYEVSVDLKLNWTALNESLKILGYIIRLLSLLYDSSIRDYISLRNQHRCKNTNFMRH